MTRWDALWAPSGSTPVKSVDRLDQGAEQVDGVIVVGALQHRGDALQPHAGVDRRPRQLDAGAAGLLLVLHEDEIPDLDEAVAVGFGRAGRAAGNVVAVVVEDFRARAARAGVAHGPEIVRRRDADDAPVRQAGDLLPQVEGLVVVGIDGDGQPLRRQAEFLGDQVPGELDGAVLEVVAEREIAEHLEEGVVPRGVADIVEVVVLAAGAHAFLRGGGARIGALFEAGEDVLELHHPGIGEHQGRIVARHERRGRHDLVPVRREIVEKGRSDFVDAAHVDPLFPRFAPIVALSSGFACKFHAGPCSGAPRECPGKRPAKRALRPAKRILRYPRRWPLSACRLTDISTDPAKRNHAARPDVRLPAFEACPTPDRRPIRLDRRGGAAGVLRSLRPVRPGAAAARASPMRST